MTSFSLPWYAIVGAEAAVMAGLPVIGALLIAVLGPTAGRYTSTSPAASHPSSLFGANGSWR